MSKALMWKWVKSRGVREWGLLALVGFTFHAGSEVMGVAMSDPQELQIASLCNEPELLATDFPALISSTEELQNYGHVLDRQQRAYDCIDKELESDNLSSMAHHWWNESQWLAKDATDDEIDWVTEYGFNPGQCLANHQRAFCILRNFGQQGIKNMANATNAIERESARDQINAVRAAFEGNIVSRHLPIPAQPANHVLNARFIQATAGYSSRSMFVDATPMSIEVQEVFNDGDR